jgi:hypothetical protein
MKDLERFGARIADIEAELLARARVRDQVQRRLAAGGRRGRRGWIWTLALVPVGAMALLGLRPRPALPPQAPATPRIVSAPIVGGERVLGVAGGTVALSPGGQLAIAADGALTLTEGRIELRRSVPSVVHAGGHTARASAGRFVVAFSPRERWLSVEVNEGQALVVGALVWAPLSVLPGAPLRIDLRTGRPHPPARRKPIDERPAPVAQALHAPPPELPALPVGASHFVAVDEFRGGLSRVEPSNDTNDGIAGDNPAFVREGVSHAHRWRGWRYWFTRRLPANVTPPVRAVEYRLPTGSTLRGGRYRVVIRFRVTEGRPDYDVLYRVQHAGGETTFPVRQNRGQGLEVLTLGEFTFATGSRVRVEDRGRGSVTFFPLELVYLGQ